MRKTSKTKTLTTTTNNLTIQQLADKTADAYSHDSYTPAGWRACCVMLRKKGYTDDQIEDILRSKWTRWAGDASRKRYGYYTSKDLERALPSRSEIADLLDWKERGLME